MKEWLETGSIDQDEQLATDLTGVEYGFTAGGDAILLEKKESMKRRGLAAPDDGDALAMTFAQPGALLPTSADQEARQRYARAAAAIGEPGWIGWVPMGVGDDAAPSREHDPYREVMR